MCITKTFIKNNLLAEILSLPLYHYNYHLSKIYPETHLKLFLSIHRGTGRTRTQDVRGGTGPLQKVLLTFSLIPMSRGYRRIVKIFKERGGKKEGKKSNIFYEDLTWDLNVFKNGPHKFLKACLPQILIGSFLNTLSHIFLISSQETRKENSCSCTVCYTMLLNHISRSLWYSFFRVIKEVDTVMEMVVINILKLLVQKS